MWYQCSTGWTVICGALFGMLPYRCGGGDGVDGDHLVQPVGDPGRRLVAADGYQLFGLHAFSPFVPFDGNLHHEAHEGGNPSVRETGIRVVR